MGMRIPGVVTTTVLLIILPLHVSSSLSNKKLCQDADCAVAISDAVAVSDYDHGSEDSRFLTFPKGASIVVYSKSAGTRMDLWSGSYNDKVGFFSKSYVKETTVHHSEPSTIVPIEDEHVPSDGGDADEEDGSSDEEGGKPEADAGRGVDVNGAHDAAAAAAAAAATAEGDVANSAPELRHQEPLSVTSTAESIERSSAADVITSSTPVQLHPAATADSSGLRVHQVESVEASTDARVAEHRSDAAAAAAAGTTVHRLPLHPTPVIGSAVDGSGADGTGLANDTSEVEGGSRRIDSAARSQQHAEEAEATDTEEEEAEKESEVADTSATHISTTDDAKAGPADGEADLLITVMPGLPADGGIADGGDAVEEEVAHGKPGKHDDRRTENEHLHLPSKAISAAAELSHNVTNGGSSMDRPAASDGSTDDLSNGSRSLSPEHVTDAVKPDVPADADVKVNRTSRSEDGVLKLSTLEERHAVAVGATEPLNASDDTAHKPAEGSAAGVQPADTVTNVDAVHNGGQPASSHASHQHAIDDGVRNAHTDHGRLSERLSLLRRVHQQGQVGRDADDHVEVKNVDGLAAPQHSHNHHDHDGYDMVQALSADGKHEEQPAESTGKDFASASADLPIPSGNGDNGKVVARAVLPNNGSATPVDLAQGGSQEPAEQSLGDPLSTDGGATSSSDAVDSEATDIADVKDKGDVGSLPEVEVPAGDSSEPKPSSSESVHGESTDPQSPTGATGLESKHDESIDSSFDYTTILAEFERMPPSTITGLVELQLWRLAAGLPSFVQQVMQTRPFGLEPPLFILANLVSLWLIACSAFAVCCAGRCDNRAQAKSAEARCLALYKQLNVAEVEVKELQAALQTAEQRATADALDQRTDSEARVGALEGQIKGLQEKVESEAQRWRSLVADAQAKLTQTTAELETSSGYIAQWQAYAQDVDEKLRAALALTPELEGRCAEAEQVAQSHREKSVTLEAAISRLEEEVVLLKQERDHLSAEAADRDEKARELESRLLQQDAERGELQAALAARELDAATLRQAYEQLLLAGSSSDGGGERDDQRDGDGGAASSASAAAEAASAGGGEGHLADGGASGENGGSWVEAAAATPTAATASVVEAPRPKRNVVEQHMQQLLEAAKARQLAHDLQEENAVYKDQLRLTQASLLELQDISRKYLAEKADLVGEMSSLKRAKDEADMSLKVLTAYFKEKEAELQRTLGEKEHSSKASGASAIELQQKCGQLQTERDQLRQEVKDIRDEMQTTERDLRKRLLETERKAHEAWVLQRSKERELAAQQTESGQLRQKLLDAELARTKVNESLTELRLQLELEKAKCQQASTALAAATAAAGDSLGDGGLNPDTAATSSKQQLLQQQPRDRPASRSSSAAGPMSVRPLLLPPPPPPLLSHLSLLPPLRPPLPPVPFGLPPGPMLPGGMPMMPPPPMMRDPRDRHSHSPPPVSDRMPSQLMSLPPDGVGAFPPPAIGMDPRSRPLYGSMHDLRDVPMQPPPPMLPSLPPPLRGLPPFDGLMRGPVPSMGPRGIPLHQLPMGSDSRVDAFGARPPPPLDPSFQFIPVDAQGFLRGGSVPGPVMSSPQRFAPPPQGDFMGALPHQAVRPADASVMNLSAISNDGWNTSIASAPGDGRGQRPSSGMPQGSGAADRSGGYGLPQSRGGV